jgi:hypothetical protein
LLRLIVHPLAVFHAMITRLHVTVFGGDAA